jgi:hypothetical protein
MAKSKQAVNEKLASVFADTPPANPAPSAADKAYLKSLTKRGYTETEIIQVAAKAGFKITSELFIAKPKKPKVNG